MMTALELLSKIGNKLEKEDYEFLKSELEREQFLEDFEKAFEFSFKYDRSELKGAVSRYTNEEQDKVCFVKNMYYRDGIRQFLNKYWDRMAEIIVLVIERLRKLDEEEKNESEEN